MCGSCPQPCERQLQKLDGFFSLFYFCHTQWLCNGEAFSWGSVREGMNPVLGAYEGQAHGEGAGLHRWSGRPEAALLLRRRCRVCLLCEVSGSSGASTIAQQGQVPKTVLLKGCTEGPFLMVVRAPPASSMMLVAGHCPW